MNHYKHLTKASAAWDVVRMPCFCKTKTLPFQESGRVVSCNLKKSILLSCGCRCLEQTARTELELDFSLAHFPVNLLASLVLSSHLGNKLIQYCMLKCVLKVGSKDPFTPRMITNV